MLDWFTGGADYAYTTLILCMQGDEFWARHLVASKAAIFASYLLVAAYLFRRWRAIRRTRFAKAMLYGAIVFIGCGAVHLLNGVEYVWPARRLEALMSYAVGAVNLMFVYELYRIRALENVLRINVTRPKDRSVASAEGE